MSREALQHSAREHDMMFPQGEVRMMVFAVRDRLADAFLPLWISKTVAAAIRAFHDSLDQQADMKRHAQDFELYELGFWSERTGRMDPRAEGPNCIAYGKDTNSADAK